LTDNFSRALTITLTIMSGLLFWLAAFMINDTLQTSPSQNLLPGDILVPAILFFSAVPVAWIVGKNLIPRLFTSPNRKIIAWCRVLYGLGLIGILVFGFIY
jgi:hypothetical protein